MKMTMFTLTFTITVNKREKSLEDVFRDKQVRAARETMLDKRSMFNLHNH
ncbi:YrzI family small protein [Camelliibacillus cellulosilyticus]|uniref:YrzI family small protein n=1 Tax=Camelliibacillus cellulosilyticus TaxID=2174486 RepID=A0ABV9GKP2_9BACL